MKKARNTAELRRAIRSRGLSYRQLGMAVGRSRQLPVRLLNGECTEDTVATRLAWVLQRDVDDLFADVASSNEQHPDEREAAV